MSKTEVSSIPKAEHDELCCTYATLLLQDEGQDITEESLKKIIDASGNKVDAIWMKLFAKALKGVDISSLFACSTAAPSAPSGSSAAPVEKKKAAEVKPKEQPKEEPKEEEEIDMGGLFDF